MHLAAGNSLPILGTVRGMSGTNCRKRQFKIGGNMINIAMRSQGAIDNSSLSSINTITCDVVQAQTITSLNARKQGGTVHSLPNAASSAAAQSQSASTPARPQQGTTSAQSRPVTTPVRPQQGATSAQSRPVTTPAHPQQGATSAQSRPASIPASPQHGSPSAQSGSVSDHRPTPPLQHMVQKGQKTALESKSPLHTLKACLGWNTTNAQCDVDVSAFLLDNTGKVLGDAWFIFYGQTESPDRSTIFCPENSSDRESITVYLDKLNPTVKKIVFVLTIHEALEKRLHFGMVQDAYIRILNADSKEELVSFKMTEYYSNVISMMIGEVYQHNGVWKFNAVGNGVANDLSGLCELYGVQVSD